MQVQHFPRSHLLWADRFRMLTWADQGNISHSLAALWSLVMLVYRVEAEAYRWVSPVAEHSDEWLRWCLDSLPDVNALCINIEWHNELWGLSCPQLVISTLKGRNTTRCWRTTLLPVLILLLTPAYILVYFVHSIFLGISGEFLFDFYFWLYMFIFLVFVPPCVFAVVT